MAVTAMEVLHGILTPNSFYSDVLDCTPAAQQQILLAHAAGHATPLFTGIRGVNPRVSFSTRQLATLFGECTSALLFSRDIHGGNTDLYYRAVTAFASRGALSSVTRLRMAEAFMHVNGLTLEHQGDGSAQVTIVPIYDGTNAPIVSTGSAASESGAATVAAAEHFGLGPVVINTSAIQGIQSATIDFGHELIVAGSASEPYPTFVGIRTIAPTITLHGMTAGAWASYGMGAALTGLTLYGRKVNPDAAGGLAYYADASAVHLKFTASTGVIAVEQTAGGGNADAATTIRLHLHGSAVADALTFAVAAIT